MVHPFFDEIRNPETKLPNGKDLPPLFNFTALGKQKELLMNQGSKTVVHYCVKPNISTFFYLVT